MELKADAEIERPVSIERIRELSLMQQEASRLALVASANFMAAIPGQGSDLPGIAKGLLVEAMNLGGSFFGLKKLELAGNTLDNAFSIADLHTQIQRIDLVAPRSPFGTTGAGKILALKPGLAEAAAPMSRK